MRFKSAWISAVLVLATGITFAQSSEQTNATFFTTGTFLGEVPSIAEQLANGTFVPAVDKNKEVNQKRADVPKGIPGKGSKGPDPLIEKQVQNAALRMMTDPIIAWECASSNTTPTDPTGAVGPDHYMNSWNSAFRIWDKDGNPLTPPASLATIWSGEDAGDPIVMYDSFADRFFISQFSFPAEFLIAVSTGPDPVNDGWYTYEFGVDQFPDYPKWSTWSDGYYVTANKNSNNAGNTEVVYGVERDVILNGGSNPQMVGFPLPDIETEGFYSPLAFNATGATPPPTGNVPFCYIQDDTWNGVSDDHMKIWTVNIDWNNTGSSTISDPQEVITEDFDGWFDGGSFSNLEQPSGPDIDCLQATVMYMAQFREFGSYNACVVNWVVDLDGNDDYAGVRWMELRQDAAGEPWSIYQQGTYVQPDGLSAFCGSIALDAQGNIGLGYSVVSPSESVSLRFTGRLSSDPLGTMTLEEGVIAEGAQNSNSFRYGDYSQLTLDPSDECTFWFVGEHFSGGSRKNSVGAFKLGAAFDFDIGVISVDNPVDGELAADESITVTVRNFGAEDVADFPVMYQVDGGVMIEETYSGTLAAGEIDQFTFDATSDMSTAGSTYTIWASTGLENDENTANDAIEVEVTHLDPSDIGVTSITSPVSSTTPGPQDITVVIENFGFQDQSNFEVSYEINGGTPVTEVFTGVIAAGGSDTFTFDQEGDFSALGTYDILAYTGLGGDVDPTNDESEIEIEILMCMPQSDCSYGDGFQTLILEDINNNSGCDPNGYGDYTNLSTELGTGITYEMTVNTGYGDQFVKTWIDFNDNFVFENNEVIVNDYLIAEGLDEGDYTAMIPFPVPDGAAMGEHLMRAKANWAEPVPAPCDETTYGETEDYTVVILEGVSVQESPFGGNDMVIADMGNGIYNISLQTLDRQDYFIIRVFNSIGQQVVENKVYPVDGQYTYQLNMSYAAAGAYLVRFGTWDYGQVEKIMVR